ncbi:phage holin family protein [uncultured Corynebacterium sp.]|uniref:phage holin family protein n=1 Tax=uncultured Corynebacterium sp. TaxID=159447 RepID=UPI0025DF0C4F|nr:phage holin family protein [uncultured Corynebacterium sp.]
MSSDDNKGLFTDGSESVSPRVTAVPLSDVDSHAPGEASIGTLVQSASAQVSSLVRSEIELAKAEIAGEAKKGAVGGAFFAIAGVVALYSSFFLFFFLAELLAVWLPRWAAFLIVFVLMLVIAGIAGFIGLQKVKKMGKPEKTIRSVQDLKTVIPAGSDNRNVPQGTAHATSDGLYT